VLSAFHDTRFESSRSVGDLARRDPPEQPEAEFPQGGRRCPAGGEQHPCGEDVLAGRSEADLPRLLAVDRRRLTGGLLPVAEHLRQERPEHDRRREDSALAEQAAVLAADPLARSAARIWLKGSPSPAKNTSTIRRKPLLIRAVVLAISIDMKKPSLAFHWGVNQGGLLQIAKVRA
jgi:hypothetical protein